MKDFNETFSKEETIDNPQANSFGRIPICKTNSVLEKSETEKSKVKDKLSRCDTDLIITQNDKEKMLRSEQYNGYNETVESYHQGETKRKPMKKHVFIFITIEYLFFLSFSHKI